jgi:hypothetical protein
LVTVSGSKINHEIQYSVYHAHTQTHTISHTNTHNTHNVGKREQAFRRLRVVANVWQQKKIEEGYRKGRRCTYSIKRRLVNAYSVLECCIFPIFVDNSSRIISYSIHLKKLRRRHRPLLVVLSVTVSSCRKFGRVFHKFHKSAAYFGPAFHEKTSRTLGNLNYSLYHFKALHSNKHIMTFLSSSESK